MILGNKVNFALLVVLLLIVLVGVTAFFVWQYNLPLVPANQKIFYH